MKSKLLLGLLLAVACTALWSSDRTLRRLMKMDTVVLQGQTGLSWIDELIAKRTSRQAELAKLQGPLAAAKTPEARVAAYMAIANFEGKSDSASRGRLRALRAVIKEGGNLPQSATAYSELIQQAQAKEAFKEGQQLLKAYAGMIQRMPAGRDKMLRLLETWKFSINLRLGELELKLLETIHFEYPVAREAMDAYEALKNKCRETGRLAQLPGIEKSIEDTRALLLRTSYEEALVKDIEECLVKKDLQQAQKYFFSMTPGLSSTVNYWNIFSKILALIKTTPNAGPDAARQAILKASRMFTEKTLVQDQAATLFLSAALLCTQVDQWKEAQANLERSPDTGPLKPWKQYIQARCWAAGYGESLSLPMLVVNHPSDAMMKFPSNAPVLSVKRDSALAPAIPPASWYLTCNQTAVTIEVKCSETNPQKMVANKTQRDSNTWEDDCVEVFLMPARGEIQIIQLVINSKGTLADLFYKPGQVLLPLGMAADLKWNSSIQAKAVPFKEGWGVQVTIPWKEVGIRYSDGACFLNVRRHRYVTGKLELSSWTEAGLTSYDPTSLGLVFFPNKKPPPPAPPVKS